MCGTVVELVVAGVLKTFLSAVVEAMRNPRLVTRLLQLCERNERAAEEFRREAAELSCLRVEHDRHLAETSREQEERLRVARARWSAEEEGRRARLERDEAEILRRKEFLVGVEARLPGRVQPKATVDAAPAEHGALPRFDLEVDHERQPAA
jgi:hypothetical protein